MTTEAPAASIRLVSSVELERQLPAFTELLRGVVNGGSPMGFLAPLGAGEGMDYWLSLRAELNLGTRLLLAAYIDGRLVGSSQLALSKWPNSRHRAEVQKVFVAASARGFGVGRALMAALHDRARQHGRWLVVLSTRRLTGAQEFYEELGYRVAGVLPGYTIGRVGERYDTVMMYQELSL